LVDHKKKQHKKIMLPLKTPLVKVMILL